MLNTYSDVSAHDGRQASLVEPNFPHQPPKQPRIDLAPFKRRHASMKLEALSKWYKHWRDISRYVNPSRGFFEGMVPNYNQQIDYRLVMDGAPARFSRILSAGMSSGMTPQTTPWFKTGLADMAMEEQDGVREWLDAVDQVMLKLYARSGFYGAAQHVYEELGLFGTGAFGMFEDDESILRCRSYTIGEYFIAIDSSGRACAFARQFWMTVDQLVEEYGFENVSAKTKNQYRSGNRDTFVPVAWLCEPNTTKLDWNGFGGLPWRSVTWEIAADDQTCLRVSGFEEFPFAVPCWDKTTTADTYGRGPGWYSLGDVKMLYRLRKDMLLAVNKVGDPPVQADSSVDGVVNTLPGGVTRYSAATPNAGVKPTYQVNPDVAAIRETINEARSDIGADFFADMFLMMVRDPKREQTAREVAEKHEEKILMLGPVLERVKGDMLEPAHRRYYNTAMRRRLIPPPPPSIQGQALIVRYTSILAQAQKMVGALSIEQEMAFVGTITPAFPQAADCIDVDEAVRNHADIIGVPPKMVRSKDAIAQIRAERARQMEQAQAQQDAAAAVAGAKALSETQIGGWNVLEHMAGVEAGAGA